MKINVSLNQKSIKDAISALRYVKKTIPILLDDFLEEVAKWLIARANEHLEVADIGENVKLEIKNSWKYERTATGMLITNNADQAAFVEFGVGLVGQQHQHFNASQNPDYNYNTGSKIREDGTWIFNPESDDDIDIQAKYILRRGETTVTTRGQPAVMYAYDAIVDIKSGDTLKRIWEKNKKRYFG